MPNSRAQQQLVDERRDRALIAMRENGGMAFARRINPGGVGQFRAFAHAGSTAIHVCTLRKLVSRGLVRRELVADGMVWRLVR